MASPHSTISGGSNPFAGPDPPSAQEVRDVNIIEHVLVRLSQDDSSYYSWKTYFHLLLREYRLQEHIDGSIDGDAMRHDPEWSAIEASLIRWFYLTVSTNLFHTVMQDDDDAYTVWTKLNGLFTDNRLQQLVFLQQEFFGCHQNDSSIDEFCTR